MNEEEKREFIAHALNEVKNFEGGAEGLRQEAARLEEQAQWCDAKARGFRHAVAILNGEAI